MIRKMQNPDINRIADIWLKTNLKAHDFIPEQYWTSTSQFNLSGKMCIRDRDWQIKGYDTSNGYMGYVEGKYILFASEQEYFEFMED